MFKAPAILICRNNGWAISVPRSVQTAAPTFAQKAIAYGMPGVLVDGNDILAMIHVVAEAAARGRRGDGPTLIEARTYRRGAHSSSDDPSVYRDPAEPKEWERRDPLDRLRKYLLAKQEIDAKAEADMRAEIIEQIADALRYAERQAPKPPLHTMFEDVYADMPWHPMPEMNIIQAVNDALRLEMRRDPRVVVLGEDVGRFGGVFRATSGLQEEFGADRCIDTPLAESGIIGAAIGMALYGLRPVPEIQFADFIYPAYDQIVNELAKLRYRSGGEYPAPVVIRTPVGGGIRGGHYHSQSPEALFIHVPGLKVVCPSNPIDAKGLLATCIRGEDPVIFMEPKRVYRAAKGNVPEGEYTIPLGEAKVVRGGDRSRCWPGARWCTPAMEAGEKGPRRQGYDLEVIDLRTLLPFDVDAILASVKKTGRVVVVHEAPRTCGFGAELAATIQERAILHLEAPILRVTGFDTPFPYTLEHEYLPDANRILDAVERVVNF